MISYPSISDRLSHYLDTYKETCVLEWLVSSCEKLLAVIVLLQFPVVSMGDKNAG